MTELDRIVASARGSINQANAAHFFLILYSGADRVVTKFLMVSAGNLLISLNSLPVLLTLTQLFGELLTLLLAQGL